MLVSLLNQTNVAALVPKMDDLFAALKNAVHTDIPVSILPRLASLADKVDIKNIRSYVFAPPLYGTQGVFNGTFKLIPNVPRIRQAARSAFTVDPKAEATRRAIAEEAATVWVLNGSGVAGQAANIAGYLAYQGMLASAPNQRPTGAGSTTRVVAYNGAETSMPDTAKFLADVFAVTVQMSTDPSARANFVVTTSRSTPQLTPPPAP